jgi:hypothetical protein
MASSRNSLVNHWWLGAWRRYQFIRALSISSKQVHYVAVIALIGTIVFLLLPETKNKSL